ncbi:MAG: oligosaccharide flippase family protein [Actinomycetota bacterium]|nr:oligosaccharide flippase family protein [Actinomycetota bacterium]
MAKRDAIQASQLAPIAAGSAATTIWLAFLGLITTPFMLHTLGASAYAVFALITIMAAYLSNLELGFGHATLQYLARARAHGDADAEARVIATSLCVFVVAGVLGALVAFLAAPAVVEDFANFPASLEDDAVGAVRLAALVLFLTFLYSFAQVALQALGRFRPLLLSRVVFGTLLSLFAVVAAALFGDVRAVLAGQVIVSGVSVVVVLILLAQASSARLRLAFHGGTFREMSGFGILVLLTGLTYQLMLHGPPTVLAGSAPSAEVAAFAVAAIVLQQLTLLVSAASTGFLPFASRESITEDRIRLASVFRSHTRLTIAVLAPVVAFLVVFADPLLTAWVGADFASRAEEPLKFLALAGFVLALSAPPGDVTRGLGRPSWNLAHGVVGGVLSVVAAVLLVDSEGAGGAALGLLCGVSLATAPFFFLVAGRLLGQSPARLSAAVFAPAVTGIAVGGAYLLASEVVSGIAGAALAGVLFTPLYAFVVFRVVLDDQERTTLDAGLSSIAPLARILSRRSGDVSAPHPPAPEAASAEPRERFGP